MLGRDTFTVRVGDDALAPHICEGDYVSVDPDEPAVPGRFVAVWDAVRAATTLRLLARSGSREVLRVFDDPNPIRCWTLPTRPTSRARSCLSGAASDDETTTIRTTTGHRSVRPEVYGIGRLTPEDQAYANSPCAGSGPERQQPLRGSEAIFMNRSWSVVCFRFCFHRPAT